MAVVEAACWFVLREAFGNTVVMSQQVSNNPKQEATIENGVSIAEIEKALVLLYSKSDIEDSLYFLEKRGYLLVNGFGIMNPRLAYSLTDAGIQVVNTGEFAEEERVAIDEGSQFQLRAELLAKGSGYSKKIWLLLFKGISSYGESPLRVAIVSLVVILVCAGIYSVFGVHSNLTNSTVHSFSTSLYFSIVTFTTLGYGDYSPIDGLARVTATIEALVGMFLMSLFLVTLVRKFGRW